MSFLNKIFENEGIKKAAFGTVKKQMVENGLSSILLDLDEAGEIRVTPNKEKVVCVPAELFGSIPPGSRYVILADADFKELCRMASAFQQIGKDINNAKRANLQVTDSVTGEQKEVMQAVIDILNDPEKEVPNE